uniref:Uncharacterized protein n=1 Tax=Ixodes ricinus TaxID=34613 RepID=A0A6B0UKV3_IXORI
MLSASAVASSSESSSWWLLAVPCSPFARLMSCSSHARGLEPSNSLVGACSVRFLCRFLFLHFVDVGCSFTHSFLVTWGSRFVGMPLLAGLPCSSGWVGCGALLAVVRFFAEFTL